ncbi:unnamed protein product [Withania somnifera]
MANKKCFVTFVICICMLCYRTTDENIVAQQGDKGLDWWYPWFGFHPWFRFHPRPSPFVHPPMPVGGFRHRFPHPWPFMHPPKPSSSEEEKN